MEMERVRWARKVKQAVIWQFYQNDARGTVDEEQVAGLGEALLQRCKSVILVSNGQVECPRCGAVFQVRGVAQEPVDCPTQGCGWQVPHEHYHNTWKHQDLIGSNAQPYFEAYTRAYPKAQTVEERSVCIDCLIHAFHYNLDVENPLPHRPAANNLIEGSLNEVIRLLDRLFAGNESEESRRWRENVQAMQRIRRGKQ